MLLQAGVNDPLILVAALIVNGFTRFVSSGLSASLPHVVPRDRVVAMNSVATAAGGAAAGLGAVFMVLPRWLFGADDTGAATIILIVAVPVLIALWLSWRFPPHMLGPDDSARAIHGSVAYAVATGWATAPAPSRRCRRWPRRWPGWPRTGWCSASTACWCWSSFGTATPRRSPDSAPLWCSAAPPASVTFLAAVVMPLAVARWGRYATANGSLALAALVQLAGAGLQMPMMVVCGFLLGVAGQVVKLCADSAMQLDVDDALRGHVFAVQDSLFWIAFIIAMTLSATVIPADGHEPGLALAGVGLYLLGLAAHATIGRRRQPSG